MASELCGQAAFTERVHHRRFSQAYSEDRRIWHDVMTADMIRQLPAGHGLVIRGSMSPVIARLCVAWKDRAYKAARRSGTAVAVLSPASPPPGIRTWPGDRRPGGAPHLTIVPDFDAGTAWEPDDEDDESGGTFGNAGRW